MAKVRIIEYEGSDEQILRLLTQGTSRPAQTPSAATNVEQNGGSQNGSVWETVATKFHKEIEEAVVWGYVKQKKALVAWLEKDGVIDLPALCKAAGVKAQRDFGGVGGSLTKNMRKAGGPREWFQKKRDGKGVKQYEILDALVEPLKQAFGIK